MPSKRDIFSATVVIASIVLAGLVIALSGCDLEPVPVTSVIWTEAPIGTGGGC